tara:strand:+ start:32 stop:310 length:279 start_codon:yes stop_codon:yes gene_type:complete
MKKLPALLLTLPLALTSTQAYCAPTAKLEQLFHAEMLNANLRYFESIAGVARESWGDTHRYNVDGCSLEVSAPAHPEGTLIVSVSILTITAR